jgi:hypothetical protein
MIAILAPYGVLTTEKIRFPSWEVEKCINHKAMATLLSSNSTRNLIHHMEGGEMHELQSHRQ